MEYDVARELPDLLASLVRIPSVNPSLDPESPGEAAIAGACVDWLTARGVRARLEEAAPGRPNVVAEVGDGAGPTLVLCAHLDTVPPGAMADPFEPVRERDRLYGRGAYDMKGGVAAVMCALAGLARRPPPGRVLAALVADEEYASIGATDFVRRHRADACILTEPSGLDLIVAHKGFIWLEVTTHGVAAHGSRWDVGESAISRMAPIVAALTEFDARVLRARTHPLCGPASLHCATVAGGEGLSTYASECVLRVERRTLPGEAAAAAARELEDVVRRADPRAAVRVLLAREPTECDPASPIIECVRDAARRELGREVRETGVAYWMDAAVFAAAGVPAVNLGGGGDGAHGSIEWADLASHAALARVLVATAARFFER